MKKALVFVCLVGACSSIAFATWTRVGSLGLPSWMIMEDDTLLWMNPARTGDHTGILWGEWNAAGSGAAPTVDNNFIVLNAWGGMSADIPYDMGLAVFVGRPYTGILGNAGRTILDNAGNPMIAAIPGSPYIASPYVAPATMADTVPSPKYDLFLSRPMENMDLGLGLSVATYSDSAEVSDLSSPLAAGVDWKVDEDFRGSDVLISLGMRKGDVGAIEVLDIILELNLLNAENTTKIDQYITVGGNDVWRTQNDYDFSLDSGMNLSLTSRAVIPYKSSKVIGKLNYTRQDISSKFTRKEDNDGSGDFTNPAADENYRQSRDDKTTAITLGGAINSMITERTMMVAGLSMTRAKSSRDNKTQDLFPAQSGTSERVKTDVVELRIPLNMGLETTLSERMDIRFGVEKELYNTAAMEYTFPQIGVWDGAQYPVDSVRKGEVKNNIINPAAVVTLGLGWQLLNNVVIDALMRQELLFTGGFILSGVPETLAAQLTATLRY